MPSPTKEKIIENFNRSIDAIGKAHSYAAAKDFNTALEELSSSAGLVYSTIEWFLKYYLYSIFPDPTIHSAQRNVIEAPPFKPKMDLFKANANPTLNVASIDISSITDLKNTVRNDPEHSGSVPHYNSLLNVLTVTRQLLITYMGVTSLQLRNLPENQSFEIETTNEWLTLFSAAGNFSRDYNYILLTDRSEEAASIIKPLALIDWNAIIDFDNNSETNGLFSLINTELCGRRAIHQFTLNDSLPISFAENACYWIYANGLTGRTGTTFTEFRFWNSNYSSYLARVMSKLQLAISSKPSVVIVNAEQVKYATEIVKLIFNAFGSNVKFVFISANPNKYVTLAEEYEGILIEISAVKFTTGLLSIRRYFNPLSVNDEIAIPNKDGGFVDITQADNNWLAEDLELFHRSIFDQHAESLGDRTDFYKGGKLGPKGLMMNYDLPREFTGFLEQKVEKALRERVNKVVTLFHYPGVGATTISKRIGWKLKDKYPVAFLRYYRPSETINRLYQLFQLSSLPPLIILDSEIVNLEQSTKLQQEALSRNFPITFLEVQRKLSKPTLSGNQVYLGPIMSDKEILMFSESYGELVPEKITKLRKIVTSSLTQEKHPLFFGLTAFEENFTGLHDFVTRALQNTNEVSKKIVAFISLVGIYAQKTISAQTFSGILAHPESEVVKLQTLLNEPLQHLIVKEDSNMWRPLHYLIAKQYLTNLFGGEEQMKVRLAGLAIEFIELVGNRASNPTIHEFEILDRLFIERYDEDDTDDEKPFSKLIQDGLYDETAKLAVFTKLTDVFPDKSHYWSHLARYYNLVIKDQDRALECIENALEIDREQDRKDATLFHIKGMILKSQAAAIMQRNWHKANVDPAEFAEIRELITKSNTQFEIARQVNPNSDYGYITNIDAITHYLDFSFKKSKAGQDRSKFLAQLDDFDLKLFTDANLLLEELRSKIHHNPEDFYYLRAKGKLLEYFNNYKAIIQAWHNLLSSPKNSNKLAIRQNLVYAYVSRADGWEALSATDVDKIIRLLNENISIDPRNSKNIFLWFNAARYSPTIKIGDAILNLVSWKALEPTISVNFYLSILYVIQAIDGNSVAVVNAKKLVIEVSENSRNYPQRNYVSEWYGNGAELARVKRNNAVVSKDGHSRDLTFDLTKIEKVKGKISLIKGPENGEIEFADGLTASFIPARADGGNGFVKGRDENKKVTFILGFAYDGLKAYEVAPSE